MAQPGVTSFPLRHALFFTASFKHNTLNTSNAKSIVHSLYNLLHKENSLYTIAFGNSLCIALGIPTMILQYKERKYSRGVMLARGGDIFVHLKNDNRGELQGYAIKIRNLFSDTVLSEFEDLYGFVYDGRDLSGFIDGINNPSTIEERLNFGVDPNTNAYLCIKITQKWIHDMDIIRTEKDEVMEQLVGRTRDDGEELLEKTEISHVARMKGSRAYKQTPKYRIVRQSMPYGTLSKESGLFFIAYSKTLDAFEFMLDRMIEQDAEDGIFNFSKAVTGAYWYAPSQATLQAIKP